MSNKRELIYVATPFTHVDRAVEKARLAAAERITARIIDDWIEYCVPFSPIAHTGHLQSQVFRAIDYVEAVDFPFLDLCDLLLVVEMDGWTESEGVSREIERARHAGMEIIYVIPKI